MTRKQPLEELSHNNPGIVLVMQFISAKAVDLIAREPQALGPRLPPVTVAHISAAPPASRQAYMTREPGKAGTGTTPLRRSRPRPRVRTPRPGR